ncbi:MAG: hypothetical protein OQK09_08635 [Colwellia sp.]|nr:hypothetical protein [Colwellia sp.]MCW9081565.1 hypothetical protein [Colwellia sp.]
MFATSISPAKQRVKNSLFAILSLVLFIVLMPILLLVSIGLTLGTLAVIKLKGDKMKRQKSIVLHAVKDKDYTVI